MAMAQFGKNKIPSVLPSSYLGKYNKVKTIINKLIDFFIQTMLFLLS